MEKHTRSHGLQSPAKGPGRVGGKIVLVAALLSLCLGAGAVLAVQPYDGLYTIGSDWVTVQTLPSGLVIATRSRSNGTGQALTSYAYFGNVGGNQLTANDAYGYAGSVPKLTINFSAGAASNGTFVLNYSSPGPPSTSETLTYSGCPSAPGPYDGAYFGDGGAIFVQTLTCGGTSRYPLAQRVFGLMTALSGEIYYQSGALKSGTTLNAKYQRGAPSGMQAFTIDLQNRIYTKTISGVTTSLPIFPAR